MTEPTDSTGSNIYLQGEAGRAVRDADRHSGNDIASIWKFLSATGLSVALLIVALIIAHVSDDTDALWSIPIGCAAIIAAGKSAFNFGRHSPPD